MRRAVAWWAAVVLVTPPCSSQAPAAVSTPTRAGAGATAVVPVANAFGAGVFITSVMSDPWVAVGWTAPPGGATATACFVAPDGRNWSPCGLVPTDTDGSRTHLLAVARVGATVTAGGVAVGALHGNPRPYLWSGPVTGSGVGPLNELNLPRELFGGERIITFDGLATGPLGGFAVGTWDGVTNRSVAQVWRTSDGTDWRRLDGVVALTSGSDEILAGRAITDGPHRAVLVGTVVSLNHLSNRDDAAVWWSDDGSSWSRADLTGAAMSGPGDQDLQAVAALGPHGFVAGGSDRDAATLWWSPDGAAWHRGDPLPGGTGAGATVTALAQGGSGEEWAAGVVVGSPRLWRSRDGRRWERQTLPAALAATGPAQSVTLASAPGVLLVVVQGSAGSSAALVSPA